MLFYEHMLSFRAQLSPQILCMTAKAPVWRVFEIETVEDKFGLKTEGNCKDNTRPFSYSIYILPLPLHCLSNRYKQTLSTRSTQYFTN